MDKLQLKWELQTHQSCHCQRDFEHDMNFSMQSEGCICKQELESQTMQWHTQLNSLTALEREKEMIAKQIKEQNHRLIPPKHEHRTTLLQYERIVDNVR